MAAEDCPLLGQLGSNQNRFRAAGFSSLDWLRRPDTKASLNESSGMPRQHKVGRTLWDAPTLPSVAISPVVAEAGPIIRNGKLRPRVVASW